MRPPSGYLHQDSFRLHKNACRLLPASVEPLESRRLLTAFTVLNTGDTGLGSLRQAILDANNHTGADTIAFNIPGTGAHTIQPLTGLPAVTDTASIDGRTQPGWAVGKPVVEIDGSKLPRHIADFIDNRISDPGLQLAAVGSAVRGLVINRVRGVGLSILADDAVVEGNFIGTDATGTLARLNYTGIRAAAGATIGGVTDAARNVISGNGGPGIVIKNTNSHTKSLVRVLGNAIGTDLTGLLQLGNAGTGIDSFGRAVIGDGTKAGANVIAFNKADGINTHKPNDSDVVENTRIKGNRIFSNDAYAINGSLYGFRPYSATLTSAKRLADQTVVVSGKFDGNPNEGYLIDIYTSWRTGAYGDGQGEDYRGLYIARADGDGHVNFSFNIGETAYLRQVTATVTAASQTYGFSNPIFVTDSTTGSVSGKVFLDLDADGNFEHGEHGTGGALVYVDLNNNSLLDDREPAIYTNDANLGQFTFRGLTPGTYVLRVAAIPEFEQTAPANNGGSWFTVTPGGNISNTLIGVASITAGVSGYLWEDVDRDGIFDADENVTYAQYYIFDDLNLDGHRELGEPTGFISDYGRFYIPGLLPGEHHIAVEGTAYYYFDITTSPTQHIVLTTAKRQAIRDLAIGVSQKTANVHGTVFNDANGNGTRDATETGAGAGRTITVLRLSEAGNWLFFKTYTTASDGRFSIQAAPPGTYRVTLNHLDGWLTTTPNDRVFTFSETNTVDDFDFGSRQNPVLRD